MKIIRVPRVCELRKRGARGRAHAAIWGSTENEGSTARLFSTALRGEGVSARREPPSIRSGSWSRQTTSGACVRDCDQIRASMETERLCEVPSRAMSGGRGTQRRRGLDRAAVRTQRRTKWQEGASEFHIEWGEARGVTRKQKRPLGCGGGGPGEQTRVLRMQSTRWYPHAWGR